MNSVQKVLFPAIVLAGLSLILLTRLIAAPQATVQASSEEPVEAVPPPEGVNDQADCSLGSRFPEKVRRWCGLIEAASGEHGLPADLIAAVILQESGGDPDAYSSSGAVGLMQVMPRDGVAEKFMCVNGPCFASRPTMAELFDPQFNVSYGVRMLAGLAGKYGDLREALRAYGPMDMGYRYADLVLTIYENYRD
jgi:soluble lytic murein transglycosylase-like protein